MGRAALLRAGGQTIVTGRSQLACAGSWSLGGTLLPSIEPSSAKLVVDLRKGKRDGLSLQHRDVDQGDETPEPNRIRASRQQVIGPYGSSTIILCTW